MDVKVKRGDIFLIDIPPVNDTHLIHGIRPHIVVSNEINNQHSSVINVVPLTSNISNKKKELPTHVEINGFGLYKPSIVLTEQLYSVDKTQLLRNIGYVSDSSIMEKITRCLSIQLDVA